MLVIGVCKRRNNGGKRRQNWKQKRRWMVYFYDEDGLFRSKSIKYWQVIGYKLKKVRVRTINDK